MTAKRRQAKELDATSLATGHPNAPAPIEKKPPWKLIGGGLIALISAVLAAAVTPIGDKLNELVTEEVLQDKPFEIVAETNGDKVAFGGYSTNLSYLFKDVQISDIPQPPSPQDSCKNRYRWAHELGGVDHGLSVGQFSIYARSKNIAILGAQVVVDETLPSAAGVSIGCEGGSPIETRHVSVDLDAQEVVYIQGGTSENTRPFTFQLKPGETEVFQFQAWAVDHTSRWHLVLNATIDGEPEDIVINDNGRPFEAIGYNPSKFENVKGYYWSNSQWTSTAQN